MDQVSGSAAADCLVPTLPVPDDSLDDPDDLRPSALMTSCGSTIGLDVCVEDEVAAVDAVDATAGSKASG